MNEEMNKENVKLSFIIPVYNVEAYLAECLDSIISQIKGDCEIILVNDGATDNSGKICDEYALNYAFVNVVHKENGGLSSARNAGLEHAKGRYIAFVDSDDRIASNSVSRILEWINETDADVCFMQGVKFYPGGEQEDLGDGIYRAAIEKRNTVEVLAFLSSRSKYSGSACTKIFKHSFLKKNALHFPYDKRYSEDLGVILDCLLKAEAFDCLDVPYYEYRQNRQGSITNTFSLRKFNDLSLFVTESINKTCLNKKPKGKKEKYALSFVAYEYSILLWHLLRFAGEEYKKAYRFLKEYNWVLKYGKHMKLRIIKWMARLLGLKTTSKILNAYKK